MKKINKALIVAKDHLKRKIEAKPKLTTHKMTRTEEKMVICAAHIQHFILRAIQMRIFGTKDKALMSLVAVDEQISHTLKMVDDYHKALSK